MVTAVKNAVVIVLFASDIWRSLIVLIKFFLCQRRNTTQFSSLWFLKLQGHSRSWLFWDFITKLVIAMEMIIERHHYIEKQVSLSRQEDLASERKTHLCLCPEELWTLDSCCVLPSHSVCHVLTCIWSIPAELMPSVLGGDCFISDTFFLVHQLKTLRNTEKFKFGKQIETWRLWLSWDQGIWTWWFTVVSI